MRYGGGQAPLSLAQKNTAWQTECFYQAVNSTKAIESRVNRQMDYGGCQP